MADPTATKSAQADEQPQNTPQEATGSPVRPVTDISYRSVRLGRIVDRLGPGEHTVTIIKADDKKLPWRVRIVQGTGAREIEL